MSDPCDHSQAGAALADASLADGILPATPAPRLIRFGFKDGGFHRYGDNGPGQPVEAIATPGLIDLRIVQRGVGSRYGLRDYLDVRMYAPVPSAQFILSLPCGGHVSAGDPSGARRTQHTVRSLLGALITLDLSCTALKLQTKQGRAATFIVVLLHPTEYDPVVAPSIGPTRAELEQAIDTCRASLGAEPLYAPLKDATP